MKIGREFCEIKSTQCQILPTCDDQWLTKPAKTVRMARGQAWSVTENQRRPLTCVRQHVGSDRFRVCDVKVGTESRKGYPGSLLVLPRLCFHKVIKTQLSFSDSDYCLGI